MLAVSDWRDVEVIDRLGGGDAFAAGFLAGYLENPAGLSRAVNLGAAASALKHTMPGDFLTAGGSASDQRNLGPAEYAQWRGNNVRCGEEIPPLACGWLRDDV